MARIALDFGTGNTVLARFNETLGRAETIEIPGITAVVRYRLGPADGEQVVNVVPSLIHYGEKETLIGDQVLSRGLAEHGDTVRWMKRGIAAGVTRRKKTAQGHVGPAQAGEDFLRLLLNYAANMLSFAEDEFTFTAPVEAFEHFEDWLRRACEGIGIRRLRLLDEPTACVLGYQGTARRDEHFVVFDFGCGTLDVSAVRVDLGATDDRKAVVLGRAGCDIGGMNVDLWLAADFCDRHCLGDAERRRLEAVILRQAEAAKIALSDPAEDEAAMTVLDDASGRPRFLRTSYTRECDDCVRGRPGDGDGAARGCLGCLLLRNDFVRHARDTLDRALENAAAHVGLRRADVQRLLVTGGTSLIPRVRALLHEGFDGRVELQSPFDAVARGACRGIVVPMLQHDYAIEGYDAERREYVFHPLFKLGLEYPTPPDKPLRLWFRGSTEGQTRIGMKIFEVSRMKRRRTEVSLVDEYGVLRSDSQVATDLAYACLNPENPTFLVADPPVNLQRDTKRFLCAFGIDGHRRLLVTAVDNLSGRTLLRDHPVVRL